jgi:hypothetical protein
MKGEILKEFVKRLDDDLKIVVMLLDSGREYVISAREVFNGGFVGNVHEFYFENKSDALLAFDKVSSLVFNSIADIA